MRPRPRFRLRNKKAAGWTVAASLILVVLACDDGPTPMSGVYTWGHEVNTFRPCGGTDVFWVLASDEILGRLRSAHDSLTSEPYQGIWVEAHLRHSGQEADGFAEQYDALIGVTEVLEIRSTIPEACLEDSWALPGRRATYLPRSDSGL